MAGPKKAPKYKEENPADKGGVSLFTLEVLLIAGYVSEEFAEKNPTVSRTIQIRGDQTLAELHDVIFDAFKRYDEHMYEFQVGKRPQDPRAQRYVLPMVLQSDHEGELPPAGHIYETQVDSLGLKVGQSFYYWFDFGDDWWHQITVKAIEDKVPRGKFPKVTRKVGKSPPQYLDE